MSQEPLYCTRPSATSLRLTNLSGKSSRFELCRCRANMAHVRQSGPDSGLDFHTDVLHTLKVAPSSLRSGPASPSDYRERQVTNYKYSITSSV